jgi:hypothetical protein
MSDPPSRQDGPGETPRHSYVRIVRALDGKISLSRNVVVFVGGPAERNTRGRMALSADGAAFAIVAVAHSGEGFGMAVVRLSDPPTEDEPVVWSMYPNGLDPAPRRHTGPFAHSDRTRKNVGARARRLPPARGGRALARRGIPREMHLAEAAYIKDVELDVDREGTMWLFWRDTRGSYLERRALP